MAELADLIPGRVFEREDWGAPATPGGSRRDREDVVGMTVHHTTGATLGVDDTVSWVKNIYDYHTGGRLNWSDIGYAYLVDRFGNVFVGRGRFRTLAHARGYNGVWLGVAFLGSGREGHVTPEAKRAFIGLHRWLQGDGGMVNLDAVNGHRDLDPSNVCPGDYLYQWAVVDEMPEPQAEESGDLNVLAPWAEEPWQAGLDAGVLSEGSVPKATVTDERLAVFLHRAGLFDKDRKVPPHRHKGTVDVEVE